MTSSCSRDSAQGCPDGLREGACHRRALPRNARGCSASCSRSESSETRGLPRGRPPPPASIVAVMPPAEPRTIAELRATGHVRETVKHEMRRNLLSRLRAGEALLPGIVGYDDTVLPQLANAIIS